MSRKSKAANKAYWTRYNKNPENKRKIKNSRLLWRYGISLDEFEAKLAEQQNKCAIYQETEKRWHLDHNHESGQVRGILCHRCNLSLTYIEDSVFRTKALKYLRKWKNDS